MQEWKPEYYDRFVCSAGECPFTCCQEWKILGKDGKIIALREDGTCPNLTPEHLCNCVIEQGDRALSETCRTFPRKIQTFADRREYHLTVACPLVVDELYRADEFVLCKKTINHSRGKWNPVAEELTAIRDGMSAVLKSGMVPPGKGLMILFYMLQELAGKKGRRERENLLKEYGQKVALQQLSQAMDTMKAEPIEAYRERMELFLDLVENYQDEGRYQSRLAPLMEQTRRFQMQLSSCEAECAKQQMQNEIRQFEEEIEKYQRLLLNFLQEELFANVLFPGARLSDMTHLLQWIALEYAILKMVLFLIWKQQIGKQKKEEAVQLPYELVREAMVLVSRMTGYSFDDLIEYMEEHFRTLSWEWSYLTLIVQE